MKKVTVYLPDDLYYRLKERSKDRGSLSEEIVVNLMSAIGEEAEEDTEENIFERFTYS
jgi:broad-specificity NMP kinase